MSDKQALQARLRALQELKAEYYIGSLSAFNYLKAMRWYEEVRDQVVQSNPAITRHYDLTVKQTAWFIQAMSRILGCYLDTLTLRASSPESLSPELCHFIINPEIRSKIRQEYKQEGIDLDKDPYCHLWTINFAQHVELFLAQAATQDLCWDDLKQNLVTYLARYLYTSFKLGTLSLVFVTTGEQVSFEVFMSQEKFRRGNKKDFWQEAEAWCAINPEEFDVAELQALEAACQSRNVPAAHALLKQCFLRHAKTDMELAFLDLQTASETGAIEAEYWLYDQKLYARAQREYTLGLYDIERRIALNAVHSFQGNYSGFDSSQSLIEAALKHERDMLESFRTRFLVLQDINPPTVILNQARASLERRRYIYLALHQNKKWLIEFFAR